MLDQAPTLDAVTFDHRASIVGYLNEQANEFELGGQKEVSITLRAQASNVAIMLDVQRGSHGIASPVDAIIVQACAHLGGTNHAEVTGVHGGGAAAIRVRFAAMWVAKKRLSTWTDEQLAAHFKRDRSTVSHGVKRAEEIRANDNQFRRVTDNLLEYIMRCKNCQHPLI